MKAKYKKSIILASSALSLMIGAAIVLSSNENLFNIMMRARGVTQNYSITFNTSSSYTSESTGVSGYYNNTITTTNSSGITFTMNVSNSYGKTSDGYIAGVVADTVITFSQPYEISSKRTFQAISVLSITSSSASARSVDLFFNGSASADATLSVPKQDSNSYDVASNYGTARCLSIAGKTGMDQYSLMKITSLTVTFTCNPDYDEGKTLTGITLDTSSAKTAYELNDTFDSSDVVVTAHYDDLTTADVSASATFTGYDMSTRGNQIVTVSYTEVDVTKTTTYTINVHQDVDHIGISGQTTDFTVGDAFSIGEGVVTAYYNAGETDSEVVTNLATFTGYNMSTTGEQTVTVSFDGETASYTIEVHILPVLSSIEISGQTDEFEVDDEFVFDGTVIAHYTDDYYDHELDASDYVVDDSDIDMTTAGTYDLVVTYGLLSDTVEITVEAKQAATLDGTYIADVSSGTTTRTLTLTFVSSTATTGTGSYVHHDSRSGSLTSYTGTANFTYILSNGTITIRFASYGTLIWIKPDGTSGTQSYKRTYFQGNLPFQGSTSDWTTDNINDTLRWNSAVTPNTITMGIFGNTGSTTTNKTFTKQ